MFDDLQKRLGDGLRPVPRAGLLTEANIKDGLREVRTALLEADVNLQRRPGVHGSGSTSRPSAPQLIKSVRPEQQIVKIVHDELVELMGPVDPSIRFEKIGPDDPDALRPPGLGQDDHLRQARPAARRRRAASRCSSRPTSSAPPPSSSSRSSASSSASRSSARPTRTRSRSARTPSVEANRQGRDTIILDTAGRLHVDDELMAELKQIEKKVKPHQVYFVCDALTGQDAVASAGAFNKALELDGVILTKLDGDARGGAALSVRKVTGVPIKFVGKGEKLDKLEPFDPERMVGQMLGMGDIVGLVEAAQSAVDEEEAQAAAGEAGQGEVRPQRLPPADRPDEEDGVGQGADGQDPRPEPDAGRTSTRSTPTARSSGSRGSSTA